MRDSGNDNSEYWCERCGGRLPRQCVCLEGSSAVTAKALHDEMSPGPWKWVPDGSLEPYELLGRDGEKILGAGLQQLPRNDPKFIDLVRGIYFRSHSDRRLIEQAPYLLDLLRDMLKGYTWEAGYEGRWDEVDAVIREIDGEE